MTLTMPIPVILAAVTTAAFYDVTQRRVPNALVATFAAASLAWHGLAGGSPGLMSSAAGLGVGLLLFPLFVLRGLGAGDVKFLAALGAAVTWKLLPGILFLGAVFAAAYGIVAVARRGLLARTVRNVTALGRAWKGQAGAPSIDAPDAVLLPFSAAAAAATWLVLLLGSAP